ncbi:MAG: nucleoside hydrolase [Prevotella sp.]|nr:nucleoside hydrolase [Prevotella sp.]MBP3743803.1 nucleoside hydrolase [Prevotella sp.]MBQ5971603.1 nucleoside hydrolase [Prevotella sp.]
MKKCIFAIIAVVSLSIAFASCKQEQKRTVNLIFDTDLGPDYDDVGAMAVMHVLADSGQVNILATMSSNKNELVAPCIDVINTYFNRPDIPIGAPKGEGGADMKDGHNPSWAQHLADNYPHKLNSTADAEDAVTLYRKVLSAQPDTSVTICTVGFFTNLNNLLKSEPDEYSDLNGKELVEKKVKRLVSMAGRFPEGREFNVFIDSLASYEVIPAWPTEIIFSGWEIGNEILTGKPVSQSDAEKSPIKDAYAITLAQDNPDGRSSWDLTAVLTAVKGAEPYFDTQRGTINVEKSGRNTWTPSENGKHTILVKRLSEEEIASILDDIIIKQPKQK